MTTIARWRIVWTDLRTGKRDGGAPLFLEKEQALEFWRLMSTPQEREGRVVDAECVFVDTETGKW